MSDKLSREVGKAYRASTQCQFDKLLAERAKWSRRLTIAHNKFQQAQDSLDFLLTRLVREKEGK